MATGGEGAQVCPLCSTVVEGSGVDSLQLHYLTNCSGYDHGPGSVGGGVSSSSSNPPPPPSVVSSSSAATGGASPANQCVVQFMWQPLTQMSYAKVTLLTSFESGSIDLAIDPDAGHYYSDHISVASGTYDGQLVVGDSFIHPVKKFTVEGEGIVVLEFDIRPGRSGDYAPSERGAEGEMIMQNNPSFNHNYENVAGGGGHGSYQDRDAPYGHRRSKTGTSAKGEVAGSFGRPNQFQDEYNHQSKYSATNDLSGSPTPPRAQAAAVTPREGVTDTYSRQLSEEGFDPAIVKRKTESISYTTPGSTRSSASASTIPPANSVSGSTTEAAVWTQADMSHDNTPVVGSVYVNRPSTVSSEYTMNRTEGGGTVEKSGSREKTISGVSGENRGDRGEARGQVSPRQNSGRDRSWQRGGFSVDSIHNHCSGGEDAVLEYERQIAELRELLAKVTDEKNTLQQDKDRVLAQWQGKVRRLESKLKGEGVEIDTSAVELEEVQSKLDVMSVEIAGLHSKLEEKAVELVFQEKQVKEMKNMNAALENQLTEYMDALEDQNKSVQRSMEKRHISSTELAKVEQQMTQMSDYMRKQQLEYQEALSSLQKKVGRADDMERENLKIHQLNVNLTAELEDYRQQTKTLLADLRHKEEEISSLKQRRSQFGSSDRAQLELESMKQKCDAWREEVEKLSPLRDEVAQLCQENARLQQDMTRVSEDNTGLAKQLQEVMGRRETVEGKAPDYDQLMERVLELQQVRVQLENELSPLRAERASILSENAALREGSQPEKYVNLKSNYAKLSEQCVQLQKSLTDESNECQQLKMRLSEEAAIGKKLEEANHELQEQLQAATDGKGLQAIRERMERYKSERDQCKTHAAKLHNELRVYHAKEQENLETITDLQRALEEATEPSHVHQDEAGALQQQLDDVMRQLEEITKRMNRYREERNSAKIMVKSLQDQNSTLQNTVQQLQNSRQYETYTSGPLDTAMLTRLQLQDDSSQQHEVSASPHDEQVDELYSPTVYSDTTHAAVQSRSGSSLKRHSKLGGTPSGSGASPKQHSSLINANVAMKDGISRNIQIEKPHYKLSSKQKPEVIVKRKGGNFETGVLAYVGVLDGKEMAGVVLDLPSGNNDGSFKDGKYYFRCNPTYGLYCPLANIYVEANSATV